MTNLQKHVYRKAARLAKKKGISSIYLDSIIMRNDSTIKFIGISSAIWYIVNRSLAREASSFKLEHQHMYKRIGDFR